MTHKGINLQRMKGLNISLKFFESGCENLMHTGTAQNKEQSYPYTNTTLEEKKTLLTD